MNEATGKDQHLDDAPPSFPNPTAHIEFYKKFKREADEHDNDFIKKYGDEADTTLIFAGLFSAVTSAFIVDVQSQLQPDYTQMSYTLLTIIASSSLGKIPTGPEAAFPQWTGPDPAIVYVQAILYSSLAASLLAALVATLGKQWLHRFSQVEMSGSIADRSRNRVRKLDGMVTWRFDLVMESLPLMLQISLLLLGYALSNYLFFVNRTVAGVVIGFTSFGLLFYLLIVSAATFSYNCPFQTPASLIIRLMIRFDDEHRRYLNRSRKLFQRIFSFFWRWKRSRTRTVGLHGFGDFNGVDGNIVGDLIELATTVAPLQLPFTFDTTTWDGYVQDSDSILRLFGISTDADVILTITKLIPEIVWHAGIQITPLERVYNVLLECFDHSSGFLVVIPTLRNEAYFGSRALLHLAIQRQCIGRQSDMTAFHSISRRHQKMGHSYYGGDSDLESTLAIIDHVFKPGWNSGRIPWKEFSFSDSHRAWMGHILLYGAWYSLGNGDPLPDYIMEFFSLPLLLDPPPPGPIVLNSLHIIGLLLGIRFGVSDKVVNESRRFSRQIDQIYKKLFEAFRYTTDDKIHHALEATKFICSLSEPGFAIESYALFCAIVDSQASPTFSLEKWEASRLVLCDARKREADLSFVNDPHHLLTFLSYHLQLATEGDIQDGPIQNALHALTHSSREQGVKSFDPTQPTFVRGICLAFGCDRPPQLRKAILVFLPLIADRWFNSPAPLMRPDEMKSFCKDWASAVDDIGTPDDVRKPALAVLFNMIDSRHWRPHIVVEKWKLLESVISDPEDSEPLRRCLGNPELLDAIPNVGSPGARALWVSILWLRCGELTPEVREKLETATGEISTLADRELCQSTVRAELWKTEEKWLRYYGRPECQESITLGQKKSGLEWASASLMGLKPVSR